MVRFGVALALMAAPALIGASALLGAGPESEAGSAQKDVTPHALSLPHAAARKRHTPEQIAEKLSEADRLINEGRSIDAACGELGISPATYHRWRLQFGGLEAASVKSLKSLKHENSILKRRLEQAQLRISALDEVAKGKF